MTQRRRRYFGSNKLQRDYRLARSAAVRIVSRMDLSTSVDKAVSYARVHKMIIDHHPNLADVWRNEQAVSQCVRTASDLEREGDDEMQAMAFKAWFTADIVKEIQRLDLRFRTGDEVTQPLKLLLASRTPPSQWERGVRTAATEVFIAAARQQSDGVERVGLAKFRFMSGLRLAAGDAPRALVDQMAEYRRVWRGLLRKFELTLIRDVNLSRVLEALALIEDGFLAEAANLPDVDRPAEIDRLGDEFARTAVVFIRGATVTS